MKRNFLLLVLLTAFLAANAQEKGKIRVGLDGGLAFPSRGIGFDGDLDVRYNFSDNVNAGVRFGFGYMARDLKSYDANETIEGTIHVNTNFLVHGDYYFSKGDSHFAPFIGAGIGSFSIYDLNFNVHSGDSYTFNDLPSVEKTFGGLIRTGFELSKFRMALEYYMIPATSAYDINTLQYDGTSQNNYLKLSIGFYIGGGRWRK